MINRNPEARRISVKILLLTPGCILYLKVYSLANLKTKSPASRTLAPERGCDSSHLPLRGVRIPAERFLS